MRNDERAMRAPMSCRSEFVIPSALAFGIRHFYIP